MIKIRGLLLAAKIKKLTEKKARIRNATRWSSTFETLKRHTELRDYLPTLQYDEIATILLTPSENPKFDSLLQGL